MARLEAEAASKLIEDKRAQAAKGLAAAHEATVNGGSPDDAANAAINAAVLAGANDEEAAEVGGEAAGLAVLASGGSKDEAASAAAQCAKDVGGSVKAQGAAAAAAVVSGSSSQNTVGNATESGVLTDACAKAALPDNTA